MAKLHFATLDCAFRYGAKSNLFMSHFEGGSGFGLPQDELMPDVSRRERYAEIVKATITELYGNARYWEFFKTFNESSVHDFITEYASRKAYYLVNGNRLIHKNEKEQYRFREMAENCLWEIQQKKLFNLQAEWRAGLAEPQGITVTRDFFCWEKAIRKCTIISPITADEINLYLDYLESGLYNEKAWFYHWQDYETIKHSPDGREAIPAWYRYYDSKMGTDYLMMLPDKKGAEEKKYISLWRQFNGKQNDADLQEALLYDGTGPELHLNYETLDFFITTFENKNLLNYFRVAEKKPGEFREEEKLQDALRILQRAEKNVPLPPAADWKEAVIKGANNYKISQIFTNLPIVYDEYLFRIQSGIAFAETQDDSVFQEYVALTDLYRQQIQEGKRLFDIHG